jgi:carbon monoxide dehydrogenase subunit G
VRSAPDAVWAALGNASLLVRAVPGLEQIDFSPDGTCRFTLNTAITAVSGSYTGEASVLDRPEPFVRVLRVSATGAKGKVGGDVTVRVAGAGEGASELSYVADADVEGAIAGIGQRMLASIAKRVAADAIAGLDAVLAEAAPAEGGSPGASPRGARAADTAPANTPSAAPAGPTRTQAGSAGQTPIERARRGIGLRGERAPAAGRPGPAVPTGLVAGAGAAVAAIVVGVLLRRRRDRR